MSKEDLAKRIAKLESMYDQLYTEYNHVHTLLQKIGFDEGILTLKEAANELLEEGSLNEDDPHDL